VVQSPAAVSRAAPQPLRLRLLLLLVGLAPLGAAPAAGQDWDWAEEYVVQDVVWNGLDRLHETDALGLISTRPDQPFSSDILAEDLARLYRSGRFHSPEPHLPPVSVIVRESGGGVVVELTVHERPDVRRVVFSGLDDALDEDELDDIVTTRAGELFDEFGMVRDARELEEELRAEGRLYAEVDHRTEGHASGVDVYFTVRPGPEVYVDEIEFIGGEQLDTDDVHDFAGPAALETKERELFGFLEEGPYDPAAFRRDLEKVGLWYRSQGFLDARVYKLEERFDLHGEALTLRVAVEEGERYRVRRVGIQGNRVIPEARILREIALRPGRPFLGEDIQEAQRRIRHLYGQRAYIHARVDVEVSYDSERHLLDIDLRISEGKKIRIEEIRIEGNDKTREDVIRRELSFHPGEFFDADEVQESLRRLSRLRYFNDVRLDFAPAGSGEDGREDMIIRVEEARTGSFVLGGGVSTSAGFFGNITLQQRNFDITDLPRSFRDFIEGRALTGAGQTLTLSAQPGRERSQFSVEFVEPWLFDYPVIFGLEGSIRDRLREDWLESRRSGRVTLGYRFTQDLLFRTTYRIERIHVGDIELDAVPDVIEAAGTNYLSGFRFALEYDKNAIDRYFVAYGGFAVSAYYEIVGGALGGDHDFHRAGGEANWQISVLEFPGDFKWVLQLRGEIGWQRPFGKDGIPIFERFFAGGPNSLRGFEFRTVTPQLRDKPLGGDWLILGGAEFSFPLFQDVLRGVFFVDTGAVTEKIRGFDEEDVRLTAGFGVRIKVPVFPAPVALDFGWPIRELEDDDRQVFSFSVGFGF